MILNLNDPDSIVRWWKVRPLEHGDFLAYKLSVSPEFAQGILEARRRIAADPELQALDARTRQERRARDLARRYGGGGAPANERAYEELAVAA